MNLEQFSAPDNLVCEYFHSIQTPENLQKLFNVAMGNKSLFPNVSLPNNPAIQDYIDRWVRSYINADENPARNRTASPKGSCNDPAIKAIVKGSTCVSDNEAKVQESHHNLFMSAENVQGSLLEEYIDSVICRHGWIWCKGGVLRSVDFCTADGEHLLQVKNKSNSENSSSNKIRSGTTIKKWHRLGTRTKDGKKIPVYEWDKLNKIIEDSSGNPCRMSESDYIAYVENVAANNPNLITDK
jgi:hypothetical protein